MCGHVVLPGFLRNLPEREKWVREDAGTRDRRYGSCQRISLLKVGRVLTALLFFSCLNFLFRQV